MELMFSFLVFYQMLPVETHVRDSLDRKEPIQDLVKWIEVIRLDFDFVL